MYYLQESSGLGIIIPIKKQACGGFSSVNLAKLELGSLESPSLFQVVQI